MKGVYQFKFNTKKEVVDAAIFRELFKIVRRTCKDQGISIRDVASKKRHNRLYNVRCLISVRARNRGFSFEDIGDALGCRHWTTIMDQCGNREERLKK